MNTQNSFLALNSVFPRLSETFVYQQYSTWEDTQVPFHIISSNRPGAEEVHPNMTELMSKTDYICDLSKRQVLLLLIGFVFKHPLRFIKGIRFLLSLQERLPTSIAHMIGAIYIYQRYGKDCHCCHSHFTYGATAVAMWLQALFELPYVITLHGSDVFFDDVKDLKTKLESAQHIVCISEFNKNFIVDQYDIAPDHVSIIGMGIEPVAEADLSHKPMDSERTVKLLNVGRLSEQKAHTLLLQACEVLLQKGYSVECTIVGDGELREQLHQEVIERGLEANVKMVGAKFHKDVLAMYQDFDLFVMSSVAEGMPIVLMEAMTRGLPVVGPDISGIPELFDQGNAGALFKTGSVADMCRAIEECITNTEALEARRNFATKFISDRFNSTRNATLVASLLTQTHQRNTITP